jgi:hypothetical protein
MAIDCFTRRDVGPTPCGRLTLEGRPIQKTVEERGLSRGARVKPQSWLHRAGLMVEDPVRAQHRRAPGVGRPQRSFPSKPVTQEVRHRVAGPVVIAWNDRYFMVAQKRREQFPPSLVFVDAA